MPADFESGFFVREAAWHGLGTVLGDYPAGGWEEVRKLAGLDWDPVTAPSFGFNGLREDGSVTHDPEDASSGDYFRDDDRQRIVRSDTGALLGVPHDVYTIITNGEVGEILESLLQQTNVKYETAICLSGGRKVAVCVKLDEPIKIPGDDSETNPLLAVTARHDGEGGVRGLSTAIRIVCANTMGMAEADAERKGTMFVFPHRSTWRDRIEDARNAIKGAKQEFTDYEQFATHLTTVKLNKSQREIYLAEFIPSPPASIASSDRVMKNVENARKAVRDILAGPTVPDAHRETGYGMLQASTEYLDHYRRYNGAGQLFTRQLLKSEPLKTRAVQMIEMAAAS